MLFEETQLALLSDLNPVLVLNYKRQYVAANNQSLPCS
jgi:hypothetical protein